MLKIIYAISILISFLLVGCNVMGDQAMFDDEFFQTPYKHDKVYFKHGQHLEIGDVGVDYLYQYQVNVYNNSDETVFVSEKKAPDGYYAYGGSATYPGNIGNCNTSVAPHSSCVIYYEVQIPSEIYAETYVELEYYFSSEPNQIYTLRSKMSATGQDKAILKVDSQYLAGYDFGDYANTGHGTMSFTFTNVNNNYDASVSSGSQTGSSAFAWTGSSPPSPIGTFPGWSGSCDTSTTVAAGSNCTIEVQFYPTSTGKYSGFMGMVYDQGNGRGNTTQGVELNGESKAPANFVFTGPNPYNYGTTSADVTHTFTVTNTGGSYGTYNTINITGSDSTAYTEIGNNCASGLDAGSSCTINVRFEAESMVRGSYQNGFLEFTYSDGTGASTNPTVSVQLQGVVH